MDGARLFNAATALGVPVAQVTQHVDSVTFCLSKVMVLHVSLLQWSTRARKACAAEHSVGDK